MIRLSAPQIGRQELDAVARVLRSGWLVQGPWVERFEASLSKFTGARHAVAVSSGTAALHVGLLALGAGPGDEVLVPDFTFPATANAVRFCGAKPVLVDIDPKTMNISVDAARKAATSRTRGIIPVHLFGLPADMDSVAKLAREKKLWVLEDAAGALGALYKDKPCGTLGTAGIFSFHPRKLITTGEGGMLVTNDASLAEKARQLRSHGALKPGRFEQAGLNYRLTDFQAALGVAQMKRLPAALARRRALAGHYRDKLKDVPGLALPVDAEELSHAYQAYVVRIKGNRTEVLEGLKRAGIEATLGTYALSAQRSYAAPFEKFPFSRRAFQDAIALPLHPLMSDSDVQKAATTLRRILS